MVEKNNTKASILIANYNNEKYLEECLNSILNQTYKNIEIIVIDDDSSDNSSKIINKFNVIFNYRCSLNISLINCSNDSKI